MEGAGQSVLAVFNDTDLRRHTRVRAHTRTHAHTHVWISLNQRPFSLRLCPVNVAALLLGVESQHKRSVPRAPSREKTSLRAYAARCRLNGLRRAACRLFTSERMVRAIKKLESEIEARRLAVRKDRHLWKDVGKRTAETARFILYS